jgi:hypothetical protein
VIPTYAELFKFWPDRPTLYCYQLVHHLLDTHPMTSGDATTLIARLAGWTKHPAPQQEDVIKNLNSTHKASVITPFLIKLLS